MEYMNDAEFIRRFNIARRQIRTQLGLIETAYANETPFPMTGLQAWWDVALDDFMVQLQTRVRTFTNAAIAAAYAPFNTNRGSLLNIYGQVRTTLRDFQDRVDQGRGLTFDAQYFVTRQPPT